MSEKKKYQVSIFGENYVLLSDEPESQVFESARLIDSTMKEITAKLGIAHTRDAGTKQCAILAALQMANHVLTLQKEHSATIEKYHELSTTIDRTLLFLSQS